MKKKLKLFYLSLFCITILTLSACEGNDTDHNIDLSFPKYSLAVLKADFFVKKLSNSRASYKVTITISPDIGGEEIEDEFNFIAAGLIDSSGAFIARGDGVMIPNELSSLKKLVLKGTEELVFESSHSGTIVVPRMKPKNWNMF